MTDAPAATTRGVATTDDLVLAERRGPVVLLTLNRPAKLNAWSNALEDRYFDLLEQADDDPQVRAVVVTGAGRGFCSGADLDDLRHVADATDDDLVRPRPRDFPLRVRKPVVAAIRGPVAGLGLIEALYCDVRFGDATARFTTAFARRGLIAEYGVTWLLPRVVGHSRATDLLLSSRMIDADEAHRIGLLDHLVTTGDVVIVDARRELASAKSLCRVLRATGITTPLLAVLTEGGLAGLTAEWGLDDVLLDSAGPAEVDARLRLALTRGRYEADRGQQHRAHRDRWRRSRRSCAPTPTGPTPTP